MMERSLRVAAHAGAAVLAAVLASGSARAAEEDRPFDPGRAPFVVMIRDEPNPYAVFFLAALPEEKVPIAVKRGSKEGGLVLQASGGTVERVGGERWAWRAPLRKGTHLLTIGRPGQVSAMTIHAFVMVPSRDVRNGRLNGYRIGAYPAKPLRGLAIYRPPRGFIEVTRDNENTPLSPHFTLRQFICKQKGGYPKYVVLLHRLVLKLEYLLQAVNERGYRSDSFFVMSGYRTPYYNAVLKNVQYSRHMWGGAADIFVDENPRDGVMDDLNGDGRVDIGDARLLYDLIESLGLGKSPENLEGGLGLYGPTPAHGPFVHVDARGFRARW